VRRGRGEFSGPPVGETKREHATKRRKANDDSRASSADRSGRCSDPRDSGLEPGSPVSPERHSQGAVGILSRTSPVCDFNDWSNDVRTGLAFAGQQQQSEGGGTTQHGLGASVAPLTERADASPTIENIPKVATRTNHESLR
jgi:hypothetical protein